ncbi:carbonic anhydrase family protein [Flavobacterium psychrophilum]|uniref:carbonic anhydrase family protein n=1 Tax=Flavobacterium psychrophilum TaxID=96345 RepID=UPI0007C5D55D|nr:carbonic anhydrase family protein [Flavobacterium psychrophilum]EKT3963017.1 carbonic anhydrase family protein [Flavobacterium psychrophilum]EKT3967016.1 carbonic anhydrase family protein [Flavobacterium psychrophilum]EKT4516350.1 carbonic anhydrase family protein [Flavobacterium psychrophilum]EKT4519740.1 carbonic anhydrase family protein [Flavobacterium psychrophilum]ELY2018088.1 carbonic anhydrase family protein [Flavobacterium psychrophilum]
MKAALIKIYLLAGVLVIFSSCSKNEDDHQIVMQNLEFPEGIVSYNFPLGTSNILGQTPISINTASTLKINSIDPVISYNTITLNSVQNTRENLTINLSDTEKENNYITIKGYKYNLQQFHFHRRSEHNINGEFGVMEIHFVNKSATGAYAVLGVMVKNGNTNTALETLITASPATTGVNNSLTDTFRLNSILPLNTNKYYTYSGSLTTPNLDLTPNRGPLTWVVFKNQIEMANTQLVNYSTKYPEENARIIQPLNDRKVYEN